MVTDDQLQLCATDDEADASVATYVSGDHLDAEVSQFISKLSTRSSAGVHAGDGTRLGGVLQRAKAKISAIAAMGVLVEAKQRSEEWRDQVVVTALTRLNGYIKRSGVGVSGLFERIDADKSGEVDHQEFRSVLAEIGLKFDNEAINQLMLHMDKDQSGSIQYNEFGPMMQDFMDKESSKGSAVLSSLCRRLKRCNQKVEELFGQLDTDHSGLISLHEFHTALATLGLCVSREAAARALKEMDPNDDGSLSKQEVLQNIIEFQRKRRVFAYSVLGRVTEYIERTNASVARLFSKLDSDSSGNLDVLELQEALRKMRVDLNEVEVGEIMDELDFHADGNQADTDSGSGGDDSNQVVSLQFQLTQFLDKLELFQKQQTIDTEKCAELFKQFDSDNSGFLEKEEVKQLAEHLGLAEQIAKDDTFVQRMIEDIESTREKEDDGEQDSEAHQESDGKVSYEELLPWFLQIGRSYLPQREYIVAEDMENLSREQLRTLFEQLDADRSGCINFDEAWSGAHATWALLDKANCASAFDAADDDGSGEIDFSEFETLVHCLEYLNKKRHMLSEVETQFSEDGLNDDDFHISLNILGVHVSDFEATAHFFAATERYASEGKLGTSSLCSKRSHLLR